MRYLAQKCPVQHCFEAFEPADTSRKGLRDREEVLEKSNTWPEQVLDTLNSCWRALLESLSNTQANVGSWSLVVAPAGAVRARGQRAYHKAKRPRVASQVHEEASAQAQRLGGRRFTN